MSKDKAYWFGDKEREEQGHRKETLGGKKGVYDKGAKEYFKKKTTRKELSERKAGGATGGLGRQIQLLERKFRQEGSPAKKAKIRREIQSLQSKAIG